jgi:hypothetical protein
VTQDKFGEYFAEHARQAAKALYEREDDLAHPRLNQTPAMFDPNVDRLEPRDRTGGVGFEAALICLKDGQRVARQGWNGKGMWLCLLNPRRLPPDSFWGTPLKRWAEEQVTRQYKAEGIPQGTCNSDFNVVKLSSVEVLPHIAMKTADDKILLGWLASQSDLLADDWQILED